MESTNRIKNGKDQAEFLAVPVLDPDSVYADETKAKRRVS